MSQEPCSACSLWEASLCAPQFMLPPCCKPLGSTVWTAGQTLRVPRKLLSVVWKFAQVLKTFRVKILCLKLSGRIHMIRKNQGSKGLMCKVQEGTYISVLTTKHVVSLPFCNRESLWIWPAPSGKASNRSCLVSVNIIVRNYQIFGIRMWGRDEEECLIQSLLIYTPLCICSYSGHFSN